MESDWVFFFLRLELSWLEAPHSGGPMNTNLDSGVLLEGGSPGSRARIYLIRFQGPTQVRILVTRELALELPVSRSEWSWGSVQQFEKQTSSEACF